MIACSSSRSLLDILTVSPWMLACAFFFESFTRRTISLAFSMGMPCCRLIFWRTLLPERRLQLAVGQVLQRDAALDQLLAENLLDRLQLVLAVGGQLNLLVALQLDLGVGVLQVEALANLLQRLVDGVADLLNVHLADNVERIFLGHAFVLVLEAWKGLLPCNASISFPRLA